MIGRRGFITGIVSLIAAPAIVRVASIMPVKAWDLSECTVYGLSPAMQALPALQTIIDLPNGWEPYHTAKRVEVFRAHQKWLQSRIEGMPALRNM